MTFDSSLTVKLNSTQKRRLELLAEKDKKKFPDYIRELFEAHLDGPKVSAESSLSNSVLIERIGELESELSKLSESIQLISEQSGVYRQQFKVDVISFFKMILFNPKFMLKDLKPREPEDVMELLKAVFPDQNKDD